MKVLIVCPGWPGAGNRFNGVFVRNQALDLKAAGCEITVVAGRTYLADPSETVDEGIRVYRFRWPSNGKLLSEFKKTPVIRVAFYLVSGLFKIYRVARRTRPDIINAHFAIPTGLIAILAGRFVRCPVVITAHDSDISSFPERSRIAAALVAWTLRRAGQIIPTTRQLSELIIKNFDISENRISVIPLGIDTEKFATTSAAEARAALKLPPDRPIILFVGAFMAFKGIDVLARSVAPIAALQPDVLFVLIGDGPLRESIEAEILAAGLENHVLFPGSVLNDELPLWYNAADVLAMPYPTGGFGQGMVTVEAAAAALPIVATNTAGIPESVHEGKNGFLIDPQDQEMLVDRIIRAIRPETWPALDEEVARIRRTVDHRAVAARIIDLYKSVIRASSRR